MILKSNLFFFHSIDLNKFNQFTNIVNTQQQSTVTSAQIEESLKMRYSKYFGAPIWADLEDEGKKTKKKIKKRKERKRQLDNEKEINSETSDDEEEQAPFQSTGNYLDNRKANKALSRGVIDIKVCTDANKEEPDNVRKSLLFQNRHFFFINSKTQINRLDLNASNFILALGLCYAVA
jgi:hypothetical protein